jgi:predicted nuclease with TOPRIM domain
MEQTSVHKGLEMRLEHLGYRIEGLKAKIETAQGFEKMDAIGRLDQLEHRYKDLEDRLRQLNREAPGIRHDMKNEFEKLSYDLSGTIDEFIMWVDSGFQRGERG